MLLTDWHPDGAIAAPRSVEKREPRDSNLGRDAELSAIESSRFVEEMVSWTGPLPPPEAMLAYEDALPGAGERILVMAERQVAHRHVLERRTVESAIRVEQRGQWIAAAIGVLAIVCGTYLMATDHDGWGFATIVTAIAGLLGAAVFGRGRPDGGSSREAPQAVAPSSGELPDSGESVAR